MSDLPPLPPGFKLASPPPSNFDPIKPMLDAGVEITNGYRTPGDTRRLQDEGYTAATDGSHEDGDSVDLTPGKTGWSLGRLQAYARQQFGPQASVAVHNGTHVHVTLKGWGGAPGTPGTKYAGIPPLPDGAQLLQRGSINSEQLQATGQAHDGDTLRLNTGQNGRLLGYDAFELNQQGRRPDGSLVPLGQQAHNALMSAITAGEPATATGAQTYGRPVVTLGDPMNDPAQDALRVGLGMAEPQYLKGSDRFGPYMEAERLARLNHLGGFQTNAETPEQFRHKDGPWAGTTPGVYGKGSEAFFGDEPTPFQGLRPEIAKGYLAVADDPKSTADDIVAYATANGFTINPSDAESFVKKRNSGAKPTGKVTYENPPRPMIDPGDGAFGSFARGFGDPVNVLDELGGVVDTVGGTRGRENLFNSDRRFGDILWNNIDQNRAILEHDQADHKYARLGGQLTSGLAVPALGVEGVGARATAAALEDGLSGFAAEQAAKRALTQRLAIVGGTEGAAAGAGGGETPGQRATGAVLGAAGGAAVGTVVPALIDPALPFVRKGVNAVRSRLGRGVGEEVAQEAAGPPLAGEVAPVGSAAPHGPGSAAMTADRRAELVGPVAPTVHDLPPLPPGFTLQAPFGVTRNVNERLSHEEMAALAEGVDPASVMPRPGNQVGSLDESIKANPGRFIETKAPNELDALRVASVRPANGDLYSRVKIRGPFDITKTLRQLGGVKDQGGDLAHLGVTNAPRRLEFGGNEQFLGKLINNDSGMTLDQAGEKLHELGYFSERPSVAQVIDAIHAEHLGDSQFLPEDLNAVSDFHHLQAQRYTIEQAASEGHPFVDERGSSINLDDLVANTPPAGAYEDMPRLTGKVGNINLDKLEKPQDVAALIDQVSQRVGGFSAAARGKVTNEETQRLAQEMGVKPEQFLKRQQGQALNAEQLYAARALVQRSRETVVRLAKQAVGGSDEDVVTFRKAWLKHVALEEQIAGATAEAGRALQQFKMLANAKDAGGEGVRAYLKGGGGRESIEDAAQAIVDLSEDPAKANHFMREAVKPRWRDKFNELWINSLLSGPKTHVVNFTGNALTTALSFPELAVTAAIGKVTRSKDRALFGELGARAAGMADSSLEALQRMKTAFRTGEPIDAVAKVETAHVHAIGGRLGTIIRTPTRALTAADEFWKTFLGNGALRQMAWRKAAAETNSREAFTARYEELLRNPPEDMLKAAKVSARYWTFQQDLSPAMRGISQWSNNSVAGKILLPFVKTPTNIIKFAGERSAFALAMPEVRAALKGGGRARDEALAKIVLGSGLSTAAVAATLNGWLSGGGPTDPRERAALLQSGWQPYSIRIGDRWISYQRLDPVATLFGVAADFAEAGQWATRKEGDKLALKLAESVAKNITNKTWLSGLSDAFDVLSDPERYGKGYVQKMAASLAVPALVSQTAQALDPNLKDARSIMDAIKARVPVLSESVPVRRNVWGDPMTNGDALGPDIVSPFYAQRASKDPLSLEIARLRAPLSMPQRTVFVNGNRVSLTPEQFSDYVQLSGKAAKSYLQDFIKTPEWRSMTDDERREEVKQALEDFRDSARDALKQRYPELGGTGDKSPPMPKGFASPPPLPPGYQLQH